MKIATVALGSAKTIAPAVLRTSSQSIGQMLFGQYLHAGQHSDETAETLQRFFMSRS